MRQYGVFYDSSFTIFSGEYINMSDLKDGNEKFRKGQYSDALAFYNKAIQDSPGLRKILDVNIKLINKRKVGQRLSVGDFYESARAKTTEVTSSQLSLKKSSVSKGEVVFDMSYYRDQYPDVNKEKVDLLSHYINKGCLEGRKPHPFFTPLMKNIKYHEIYKSSLEATGIKLFPQKPLKPKEEKLVPRHIIKSLSSNEDIIKCVQEKTKNKIAIYSANIGIREDIANWEFIPGIDFYCFADKSSQVPTFVKYLDIDYYEYDHKRTALYYKTHAQSYFSPYEYVIWCDQNIKIKDFSSIKYLIDKDEFKIASFIHWGRDCLYDEAKAIIKSKREKGEVVEEQMEKYRKEGFPEHFGLFETNILVMKVKDSGLQMINKCWWSEIVAGAGRDQLSFTYALWSNKITCAAIEPFPLNSRNCDKYGYSYHG